MFYIFRLIINKLASNSVTTHPTGSTITSMVSSITEAALSPVPMTSSIASPSLIHSDSDLPETPEVSSNEENSQEIQLSTTNKFDSENCFSDALSDDSGSKLVSISIIDELKNYKTENKRLEEKLVEAEIKLKENKLIINSLGWVISLSSS